MEEVRQTLPVDLTVAPEKWSNTGDYWDKHEEVAEIASTWDDAQIQSLVRWYLLECKSYDDGYLQRVALNSLGEKVHAPLFEILKNSEHHHRLTRLNNGSWETPLSWACDLLEGADPALLIEHLAPFVDHSSTDVRSIAMERIASTGSAASVPYITQGLNDESPDVLNAVVDGLEALSYVETIDETVVEAAFPLLVKIMGNAEVYSNIPEILLKLDQDRAIELLLDAKSFSVESEILGDVLSAFLYSETSIPREKLIKLIEELRPLSADYDFSTSLEDALVLLGAHKNPEDRELLETLMDSKDSEVASGAARGLLANRGFDNIQVAIYYFEDGESFQEMPDPIQLVVRLRLLDDSLTYGSFQDYFRSEDADSWKQARQDLAAIGLEKTAVAFDAATAKFGRRGPPTDFDTRVEMLSRMTDSEEDPFEEADELLGESGEQFAVYVTRYILKNEQVFRDLLAKYEAAMESDEAAGVVDGAEKDETEGRTE
ncbi:DMP19 family protein [Planctomicrobium sp. SH668]|uniref:DMP19 family protein n=1 Tax=Planctomicrobium sp. SH668 TaxID=3448126 RepID=UPI003F5BC55C